MRTFIAIALPKEIKDYLSNLQTQLKASGADVKWVAAQNIHLTLKFLGEIEAKKLEEISFILKDVSRGKNPFSVSLSCLGAFPKIHFPRIIWIGLDKGDKEIKEIAQELEQKIEKTGVPAESKPFSSHITIGRTKSMLNRDKLIVNFKIQEDFLKQYHPEFNVTKITLFKSTLTPKGPIYEVLKEAELRRVG